MFVEKHSLHQNLLQTFLIFQKIGINTTVEITNRKINTHYNEGLKSQKILEVCKNGRKHERNGRGFCRE